MSWKLLSTCLLIFAVTYGVNCFKEKPTGKPIVPPQITGPDSSKHHNVPTHISEFTDPDTGLNPFLDLEEGQASISRNVMEDERRKDDGPMMDFDLVEGETTGRKWNFDYYEKPLEKPVRLPVFETNKKDEISLSTTLSTLTSTATITEKVTVPENELQKTESSETNSTISQDVVMYASVTTAAVAAVILLVGVCWWRRKLKRISHSPVPMENGDLKS